MKRILMAAAMATLVAGSVMAQGMWNPPGAVQPAISQPLVKIEGKLALVQGHPAITVKDKTYFVQLPQMLYGFIDGLSEGATVKLEGYEQAVPFAANSFFFRVTKLTLGVKEYDLSQMAAGRGMMGGMMGGQGQMSGMMGGRGGRGGR